MYDANGYTVFFVKTATLFSSYDANAYTVFFVWRTKLDNVPLPLLNNFCLITSKLPELQKSFAVYNEAHLLFGKTNLVNYEFLKLRAKVFVCRFLCFSREPALAGDHTCPRINIYKIRYRLDLDICRPVSNTFHKGT